MLLILLLPLTRTLPISTRSPTRYRWEDNLKEGPEGEYIKVIDRDPGSNKTYAPVDLNKPAILAADGLAPSETNPQFHQQMVYAVTMTTIKNFEKALGSKVMWSPIPRYDGKKYKTEFVRRLFVYPHAIRDQNAYYSPERKALLFGYYNAEPADAGIFLPGGIVYSCLSHDMLRMKQRMRSSMGCSLISWNRPILMWEVFMKAFRTSSHCFNISPILKL